MLRELTLDCISMKQTGKQAEESLAVKLSEASGCTWRTLTCIATVVMFGGYSVPFHLHLYDSIIY